MGSSRPNTHTLVGGPYAPPAGVEVGQELTCLRHGPVIVTGFTRRLGWPCATNRGRWQSPPNEDKD